MEKIVFEDSILSKKKLSFFKKNLILIRQL